jgi:hypothetical protein
MDQHFANHYNLHETTAMFPSGRTNGIWPDDATFHTETTKLDYFIFLLIGHDTTTTDRDANRTTIGISNAKTIMSRYTTANDILKVIAVVTEE